MNPTITDADIRALRADADEHGDERMSCLCDIALAAYETSFAAGEDLVDKDGQKWTRSEARDECARVIDEARALAAESDR